MGGVAMTGLEIARLVLYGLEFISAIIVFGVTADSLFLPKELAQFSSFAQVTPTGSRCILGVKDGCQVIIAFSVLLWLATIAVIVLHGLAYIDKGGLPYMTEAIIFAVMSAFWFITALIASVKTPSFFIYGSVRTVQCFAWLSLFFCIASAVIAYFSFRSEEDYPKADAPTSAPESTVEPSTLEAPATVDSYAA